MQAMKEEYTVNTGARKGMVNCTAWKGEGVRRDFIKDVHILAASWKMKRQLLCGTGGKGISGGPGSTSEHLEGNIQRTMEALDKKLSKTEEGCRKKQITIYEPLQSCLIQETKKLESDVPAILLVDFKL